MSLNRYIIMDMLNDMEQFAQLKNLECPPIYILGGSGAILGGYFDRGTVDIDILDLDYCANVGKLFRLLGQLDYLDLYLTTVAPSYKLRAKRLEEFKYIPIYVLSKEDIIITKIGRYSQKDREDIKVIMPLCNKKLIIDLIEEVIHRNDISKKVQQKFIEHSKEFRGDYYV